MRCDGENGALQEVQLLSPHEIKLPSRKTAAKKCHRRQIQQMAAAATLGHRFASSSQLLLLRWQSPKRLAHGSSSVLYGASEVECVQIGAALKGVTATTQDGSENVWRKKNPLQESVAASAHVCIQVCEPQQEGFTTQILSCAVMFRPWRIWTAVATVYTLLIAKQQLRFYLKCTILHDDNNSNITTKK